MDAAPTKRSNDLASMTAMGQKVLIPEVAEIADFSQKCEPLHSRSTSRGASFGQEYVSEQQKI